MSSVHEIGAPFTLASLPHAINASSARTHAAGVCSISGPKKRKRTEIAVGLDGEGILIYSLQNPQLVTSYALPPQASFLSAPYSIYRKGTASRPPRRFTYAFVAQSSPSTRSQLICFAEETRKHTTTDTVKTTYTPPNSTQNIIAIDSIPVASGEPQNENSHDVLTVFDNGDIICLSSDLQVVRWVLNLRTLVPSKKNDKLDVEYTSLNTAKAVTHGFLRNREDIAAALNPSLDAQSEILDLTQVLCVLGRGRNGLRTLGLFQIQLRSPDLSATHLPPMKHLVTWDLPSSSSSIPDSSSPIYSVNANSGVLHLLAAGALISYEFSDAVPKVYSEIITSEMGVESLLRVMHNLLLTSSRRACRILDVKYNSVQALLSLTSKSTPDSRKRKLEEPGSAEDPAATPVMVAYYADLGLAVGLWDNEIVGFQLGDTSARKRFKTEGTRLIDSLGKGLASTVIGPDASMNKRSPEWQKWQERMVKLNRYASKGKIAKFEEVFAADLDIPLASGQQNEEEAFQPGFINGAHVAGLANGVGEDTPDSHGMAESKASEDSQEHQPRKWMLPKSLSATQRLRHRRYALYALSRIFRWVTPHESKAGARRSLTIDFFPPNVFQWLLQSGHLTKESIHRAILDHSPEGLETPTAIKDGDIVRTVVEFDPELHILSAILNHSHFLPIGEVVQAIEFLLQSLDDRPKADTTIQLLTNGTDPSAEAMDVDFASELDAADHEINRALSILDHDLSLRSDTLRPALIRLHTFPGPVVSSTLRSMLPRQDLESLIRLLHYEFRNGGWTSPYDFADSDVSPVEPSSSDDETDDSAVAIIASLLSSALDAIGPATLITAVGSSTSEGSTEDLIDELLQDASVALNGFWEATYIRGLLSELLRYASNLPKSQKPSSKTLQNQAKPFALDLKPDELPMLPLGAKADLGIEKTKAGKGGRREERSAREIGMLISKRVPKYSFERIVL